MGELNLGRFVALAAYCWAYLGARVMKLIAWFEGPNQLVGSEVVGTAAYWRKRYHAEVRWQASTSNFWKLQYETLKTGNETTFAWQDVQMETLAESLRKALAENSELRDQVAVLTLREANLLAGKTIPGAVGVRLPLRTWDDAERALDAGEVDFDAVMQADIN